MRPFQVEGNIRGGESKKLLAHAELDAVLRIDGEAPSEIGDCTEIIRPSVTGFEGAAGSADRNNRCDTRLQFPLGGKKEGKNDARKLRFP